MHNLKDLYLFSHFLHLYTDFLSQIVGSFQCQDSLITVESFLRCSAS